MNSDIETRADKNGGVWITVNRPGKHNALALPILERLAAAVGQAERDTNTRVIILTGAGEKYFAAGGDIVELTAVKTESDIRSMADSAHASLEAIRRCAVPVVAFLNGDAIGGGAELAVACDMRVMAPHARVGFVQARMGITSAWGGGPDLCDLVGAARATQMMSRSEMVGVRQALEWGLANAVAADGPGGAEMAAFLKPMLACSRTVLDGIKAQARARRDGLDRAQRRAIERERIVASWTSEEHWAAVDGFIAKGRR